MSRAALTAIALLTFGFAAQAGTTQPLQSSALVLKVSHGFSRADARERVSQLLQYWAQRFGVKSEWQGFRVFLSGRVLGVDLRALFDVGDHEVVAMASEPPGLLRARAESYVEKKLRKYLNPRYEEP